jgi:hypothetical protein
MGGTFIVAAVGATGEVHKDEFAGTIPPVYNYRDNARACIAHADGNRHFAHGRPALLAGKELGFQGREKLGSFCGF